MGSRPPPSSRTASPTPMGGKEREAARPRRRGRSASSLCFSSRVRQEVKVVPLLTTKMIRVPCGCLALPLFGVVSVGPTADFSQGAESGFLVMYPDVASSDPKSEDVSLFLPTANTFISAKSKEKPWDQVVPAWSAWAGVVPAP